MSNTDDRATEQKLGALHGLLADAFTTEIRRKLAEGDLSPQLLGQAAKFLKDNGVDQPRAVGNKIDTLAEAMPDIDELEGRVVPFRR